MIRPSLVLVMGLAFASGAPAEITERGATPDLEKVVGQPDRCYEPFSDGPSSLAGELLVAGTSFARGASSAGGRLPFVMSVDLEGRARDFVVDDERLRLAEVRGVAQLDDDTFVVAGVGTKGTSLARVDRTGKLEDTKTLAADVSLVGVERGSAKDFLVYGRLGSRPYYAGLSRSLAAVFERFPTIASSYGQVLKARYARARDGVWMVVQGADSSKGEVQVSLVKQDLLGATVGSTVVSSIYADFEETPDGVVLLYYTATNDTQNVFVASFDPSLKRRWVSDPLRARRGLLGPKLVVLKDRILVVAADDYKLWIVALDLRGQLLGSYHDPTAALGPGSTYFVAHDATRLLLGQPDRRGGDATHSAPDPSCTRVRILRF